MPINTCFYAGSAIQAFGNGTDVSVWQPRPSMKPTVESGMTRRTKARSKNVLDTLTNVAKLDLAEESYGICETLQVMSSRRNLPFSEKFK